MAELSKKIRFYDKEKLDKINPETIKLWKKYKVDMSLRELSDRTVQGYENDLQQWWIYIYDNQDNKCITELKEDDITEFLYYCKEQGNNSRRMKRRMSSIGAFYKFLRKKRIMTEDPMEFIDRPKKDTNIIVQTYLTLEQVNEIREKLKNAITEAKTVARKHYFMQLRCYALLSLSTMARVTAVSSISWEQIDFENREINEVLEKEGYIVDLYFSEEVKTLLEELLQFRKDNNINDGGHLFVSSYDGKTDAATTGTLNQWCKAIGTMINVPTLHPHDWRHSGATLMKNAGANLEDVSKLLNHLSTDTTVKFYIKENKDKIKENKDKYSF